MSVEQVQGMTYGKDPLHPEPSSLIGQYIRETGAQTVIRRFDFGPRRRDQKGPQRLVVAVSAKSFAKYLEKFATPNFLVHVHTPNQGTLMVAHNGRVGSYANLGSKLRTPELGTLMPHILLSGSEGRRAKDFFRLGRSHRNAALTPWNLGRINRNTGEVTERYCAAGGYTSCTHWFGNIPIGDTLVDSYTFPGNVDQHAGNHLVTGRGAQTKTLIPFESDSTLAKTVWKVPGHEQLSNVLGLGVQNVKGEFASPGYVAVSLTGPAPIERVPVVFLVVEDHKKPISRQFKTQFHAY